MTVSLADRNTVVAEGPFKGVNQKRLSRDLQFDVAEDALNVDLSQSSAKSRPGYADINTAPNGAVIYGIHTYVKQDGTKQLLVKAGAQLYDVVRATDTWTAIGGAVLNDGVIADFETANNRVYIADGGTPKVTDGTSLFDWLIDVPGTIVNNPPITVSYTVTEATDPADAVFFAGATYEWVITDYSSTWGLESPSAQTSTLKSLTLTVNASQIEVNHISGTPDSRVDKRRIYRRRIDTNEVDYFLVEEYDVDDGEYFDTTADGNRSFSFIAPLQFSTDLPLYRRISWNNDIMVASTDDEPNNLYFSVVGGTTPLGFLATEAKISAIEPWQTVWAVFTTQSIWVLSGNSPETFAFQKTVPNRGCSGAFLVEPRDEGMYLGSDDSLYLYRLQPPENVAESVETLWRARAQVSDDATAHTAYIPQSNAVAVSFTTTTANDTMLVYFFDNAKSVGEPSWVPWSFGSTFRYMRTVRDERSTAEEQVTMLGFSDGTIATLTGDLDNATAITGFWQTSKFDRQFPGQRKRWGDVGVDVKKQATAGDVELGVLFDDETTLHRIGHIDQSLDEGFVGRVSSESRQLRLRIDFTAPFEMHSYSLQSDVGSGRER